MLLFPSLGVPNYTPLTSKHYSLLTFDNFKQDVFNGYTVQRKTLQQHRQNTHTLKLENKNTQASVTVKTRKISTPKPCPIRIQPLV